MNPKAAFVLKLISSQCSLLLFSIITIMAFISFFITTNQSYLSSCLSIWITVGLILTFKHNLVTTEDEFKNFLISRFPKEIQGVFPDESECTDEMKQVRKQEALEVLKFETKGFYITLTATLTSALLPYLPTLITFQQWYNKLRLLDCFAAAA